MTEKITQKEKKMQLVHNPASFIALIFLFAVVVSPLVHATTSSNTFNWTVISNRAHSITYGGNCTPNKFYFNEFDAVFDPDTDGNASKVLPNSQPAQPGGSTASVNSVYTGVTNPCNSFNCAFDINTLTAIPSTLNAVNVEFNNLEYTNITTSDDSNVYVRANTLNAIPMMRFVHKFTTVHYQKIAGIDITFEGVASTTDNSSACSGSGATVGDINFYAWNYTTSQYDFITTFHGSGATLKPIEMDAVVFTIDDGNNITQHINADGNINILVAGQKDTSNGRFTCLISDRTIARIDYYPNSTTFCQSASIAPITIRNLGNLTISIDGNFASALTGNDKNIVLKAWRGTGSGCGTSGLGGWTATCTVTNAALPVTATTCRNYNQFNFTTLGRLTTSLLVGDTNQLCFSGDFNGFVYAGNHQANFQTGSG